MHAHLSYLSESQYHLLKSHLMKSVRERINRRNEFSPRLTWGKQTQRRQTEDPSRQAEWKGMPTPLCVIRNTEKGLQIAPTTESRVRGDYLLILEVGGTTTCTSAQRS